MAFAVADRVKESTTSTGTGTINLGGTSNGFQTFVAGIGDGNTTYYAISHQTAAEFEVGIGTVTDAGTDTLSRDTIISSSNGGSAVDFSAGDKDVIATLPSSKSYVLNNAGDTTISADLSVTSISGSGAGLTALNASNISSGTLPDARFPATLPALNGSALTDLNGSNIASGTVPNARLDAQLQDVAGLATTSGKIIQGDGSNFALSAYTIPTSDGSANQVLQTNGSGAVSFVTLSLPDGVEWQAVQTSSITVSSGRGYFVDTTSAAITLTLPTSPSQGDTISFIDYAGTFDTNNLTIGRNGHKIQGSANDLTVATERAGLSLVYVDATQGWLLRDK